MGSDMLNKMRDRFVDLHKYGHMFVFKVNDNKQLKDRNRTDIAYNVCPFEYLKKLYALKISNIEDLSYNLNILKSNNGKCRNSKSIKREKYDLWIYRLRICLVALIIFIAIMIWMGY